MKKVNINGVEFYNFGANNYTYGMELITLDSCSPDFIKRVLNKEFKGVYLNPSVPCYDEFFGVLGTEEQYKQFYKAQKNAQIAKAMLTVCSYDTPLKEWKEQENKVIASYKDWWESVVNNN